ncbi:MAG TPA: MBL fold metallo-hydrolase [Gemmatimonadales bacterium]|nr:MBL fold metallo-hydrolase [Gemmatimonadales bacterium]
MRTVALALAALLFLPAPAPAQQPADTTAKVVLLGTGTPIPDPARSGPSTAVVVGNESYIVDAGAGVVRRAVAAARKDHLPALRVRNLKRLFLTHLHSDHTIGLPDIILTPAVMHRNGPLEVWGPEGTKAMVRHILKAYQEDIRLRVYGLEHGNWAAYHVIVHEIKPGIVYRDSNVTVTAFPVHHGTWPEALGYRFDTRGGRSIVISGDEAPPLDTIAKYCNGCDVMVHEVYSAKGLSRLGPEDQEYHTHFHTSGIELGEMAARAHPKLLVLTHWLFFGQTANEIVGEVKQHFSGPVAAGADLDVY